MKMAYPKTSEYEILYARYFNRDPRELLAFAEFIRNDLNDIQVSMHRSTSY